MIDDEDRFTELCRRYRHRIVGYVLRRTGSVDDADDVTAEVFLVAWRRIDDVPEDAEALPWLYATARRVLANHRRGERRRNRLATRLAGQLHTLARTDDHRFDDLRTARVAFRSLSERDRELLALVGWEGLEHDEIATVLGCSRSAVRVRLYRARRRFRAALAHTGIDPQRPGHADDRPGQALPDRASSE